MELDIFACSFPLNSLPFLVMNGRFNATFPIIRTLCTREFDSILDWAPPCAILSALPRLSAYKKKKFGPE